MSCAALKVPAKRHSKFAPTSIDYDQRIFAFHEWSCAFGLTLLSGRARIATSLGEHQNRLLKGRKPTSAQLVKRRDGRYFLHVQLTDNAPEPISATDAIGVNMGVVNLAATDDGENFSGEAIERVSRKYHRIRKTCQARAPSRPDWAFHQLRQFVTSKATLAGIPVIPVYPRDTSRTCSECGDCEKRNRKSREEI